MPKPAELTVVNVGYRSTNYWVVSAGASRLLVDLGWPGTMGQMRAGLNRMGVPFNQIRYGLATHYHIDHAGLAQELKQAGVPLLVLDAQVQAIPLMKRWTKPWDHYVDISTHDNVTISFAESRPVSSGSASGVKSCTRRGTPTTACRCFSTMAPRSPATSSPRDMSA